MIRTHVDLQPPPSEQAAEELDCFFTNTLGMLCIAGFDGYFKRLNPAWETTLGWTLEELKSRPFLEFVHPDGRAATLVEVERLTGGGCTIAFENRYLCKDGSYKWLHWNAMSLPSQRQISAIARDVTHRRGMENQILEAGDREKERLGRELHDGLCQNLAGIAAMSTALSRKLAAESGSESEVAAEITSLLSETIGHVRDMARGLNPVNLGHVGIAAALETLASNVEAFFPGSCGFRLRCPSLALALAPEVEAHLYRIAQEALNNAVAHGRGKRILVTLGIRDGKGHLSVRDDGTGIPGEAVPGKEGPGKGTGLRTMDYRARLIGGVLEVRRRARRGTAVTCTFPLRED